MSPQPGWHGYWSNPGESGLAPVVKWTAPPGIRFGPLQHPAPSLLRVMGLASYVHAGPHVLLVRMTVDPNLPVGTVLPVIADVSWAACSDKLCVPQKARLSLQMKVGGGSPSADAALLRRALAAEPKKSLPGTFGVRDGRLTLDLPASARVRPESARFFPDENGYWNPLQARVVSRSPLRIASPAKGKPPKRISGVVSDGSSAYRLSFVRK
jgi:DsbC/DsbD-like thiol-disulfide interchange protein